MALYRTGLYVKNHAVEQVQVASTPIASFNGNVTGLYIPELIAYITAKQSGSGTPSPDNIRPIIGVSECNVVRCGVNVWSYGNVSGTKRIAVTVSIKAGTYTLSANVTSSDTDYDYNLMLFYYEDNTTESVYINRGTWQNVTFTLSKDVKSINFYASRGNSTSEGDTFSFTDIQLEVGSSATAYEAYSANTYIIQFGQTVYVCYINVTTGELTIIAKYLEFNAASYYGTYGADNAPLFYVDITGEGIKRMNNVGSEGILLSNMLSKVSSSVTSMRNYEIRTDATNEPTKFYFRIDSCTSQADIDTFFIDKTLQVVAELATPVTVQLTPTQIEQLLGANNVFADCGDVEVKFYNVVR